MAKVKFSDLGAQYKQIESALAKPLTDVLQRGDYVGSEVVSEFESKFAAYTDSRFCVGVGNGTDALEILLLASNLPRGSTVLVQDNSFVATAEAVLNVGLHLRLVDVGPDYQMTRESFCFNLDESVSAVVVTHLYGYPNSNGWIQDLCEQHKIQIIEDCAQAHGSRFRNGLHVGNLGSGGAFSFYPGKNLGAAGDAGAIVTNVKAIADRARRIRNHGRLAKYDHDVVGRNSRLDTIQALVLTHKLEYLPGWVARRRQNASTYSENLSKLPVVIPPRNPGLSSFHLFVIQIEERDALKAFLSSRGIETGIHYPKAISDYSPYSRHFAKTPSTASQIANRLLSLPVGEHLSTEVIQFVSNEITHFFNTRT